MDVTLNGDYGYLRRVFSWVGTAFLHRLQRQEQKNRVMIQAAGIEQENGAAMLRAERTVSHTNSVGDWAPMAEGLVLERAVTKMSRETR